MWCTDCDYCGEIAMVTSDGAGGKICAACDADEHDGSRKADLSAADVEPVEPEGQRWC